jgi:hypothetical protein
MKPEGDVEDEEIDVKFDFYALKYEDTMGN